MNCPKCEFKMPFQERICRRCQYCPDLGDYVRTEVPRGRAIQKSRLRTELIKRFTPSSVTMTRQLNIHPGVILLVSIIPGAGHLLLGRKKEGLLFTLAVPALIAFALFSGITASQGLPVLGLAFGVHVTSIFRISSFTTQHSIFFSIAMHVALFIVLSTLIYGPLSRLLLAAKPEYTYQRGVPLASITNILSLAIVLFFASYLLTKAASAYMSRPEKKKL